MNPLEYLRKITKSHNWDGIIYYGRNGSEQINIVEVCEKYYENRINNIPEDTLEEMIASSINILSLDILSLDTGAIKKELLKL